MIGYKHLVSLLSLSFLCAAGLWASPMVKVGDSIEIFFTGKTAVKYDSNVFVNYGEREDDFIYTVQPGLHMVVGKDAENTIVVDFSQQLLFFADREELNQANEIINISANHDGGGQVKLGMKAGYNENAQNTGDENVTGSLIRKRNYNLGLSATYNMSPKMQISSNPSWSQTDYRNYTSRFLDSNIYTLPLDVFYLYSEKLKMGGGYRFRYTDIDPVQNLTAADRHDHFMSFRLVGEISPKLQSQMSVGWQVQHINGGDDLSSISMDANFTYLYTPKVTIKWGVNRDFSASGTGQAIQRTGGNMSVNYTMTDKMLWSAGFGYTVSDYKYGSREDHLFNTFVNWRYMYNKMLSFGVGYSYQNNDSYTSGNVQNSSIGSYNAHQFDVSANVKY